MLSDEDLELLKHVRTGTDLECVCLEAAKEIEELRRHVQSVQVTIMRHHSAIKQGVKTNDFESLKKYAIVSRIVP